MKQLLFLAVIFLTACNKPIISIQNEILYYRLQQVDIDGKIFTSPIRHVRSIDAKDGNHDDDHDEDEDDDDDNDHNCDSTVLPIKIETFIVTKFNNNQIRIYWEAENEDKVRYYIVERSTDLKNWEERIKCIPNPLGKYLIIDKIK